MKKHFQFLDVSTTRVSWGPGGWDLFSFNLPIVLLEQIVMFYPSSASTKSTRSLLLCCKYINFHLCFSKTESFSVAICHKLELLCHNGKGNVRLRTWQCYGDTLPCISLCQHQTHKTLTRDSKLLKKHPYLSTASFVPGAI